MHISSIQITNYKSFLASSTLTLKPGINIVTGQNNAGKTTLLEAIGSRLETKPHRSLATLPKAGVLQPSSSGVSATLMIDRGELLDFAIGRGKMFLLALPETGFRLDGPTGFTFRAPDKANIERLLRWTFSRSLFQFRVARGGPDATPLPSFSSYKLQPPNEQGQVPLAQCVYGLSGDAIEHAGPTLLGSSDMGHLVWHYFHRRAYSFRAERFNLGVCAFGSNTVLEANASNLAEVLSNLQTNPSRLRRYNATVRRVLPQIQQVTARNLDNNRVEVLIWSNDPEGERADLAIPLSESGTGVGQVLAMLYVVLNSDHPLTILIDEPQSFLHPGAVRKLIEVLKEHPEHQYVLTTHSPTVIAASDPSTITLVKQRDGVSDFQVIDPAENEQLRQYLTEIGARLSDAFGADDVLWVEGPTEELCFPLILEKVAKRPLMGTAIMAVQHTGDLESRHAKTVFDIYERLSKGRGLLPPAVGFIFDKEGRSDKQQEDIRAQSRGLVAFTNRRLYESYLLNPRAIASSINEIRGFRDTPVTEAEVQAWIDTQLDAWIAGDEVVKKRKYGPVPAHRDLWRESIHGAHLLEHLFNDLSETRVTYQKTAYSVALTKWLVENSPDDLREVADLIVRTLAAGRARIASE